MSETAVMTLSDFLLARIAEDEAAAQVATSGRWEPDDEGCCIYSPEVGILAQVAIGGGDGTEADVTHIARHDPTRVLAECEAKRQIVEDFEILHADYQTTHHPTTEGRRFQARIAMARLALPYADRPDFRNEWRP